MSDRTSIAASGAAKPYTAPGREIYGWAVGGIATHALICMYGQAMNIFTVGFGLKAAIVGWAMMLPRVFDALIDPMMGHFSDNLDTRWGRRKPFLVLGSILAALFVVLLWWGNRAWSETAQLVYLTVMGTLFYCSWGLYSMAWNSSSCDMFCRVITTEIRKPRNPASARLDIAASAVRYEPGPRTASLTSAVAPSSETCTST